jgi:excisionase family DNA binding protein
MAVQKFLTIEEVAELLRLKPSTVYKLTARRAIPFLRLSDGTKGKILFDPAELEAWLQSKRKRAINNI